MPDPGDANLARLHFRKQWARWCAGAFREQRRNPNAGDEISLSPIAARPQFDPGRFFRAGVRRLANYFSLSRKRIRHKTKDDISVADRINRSRPALSQQAESQLPVRHRQRRRDAGENSVAALRIWPRIAFVVQSLEGLEQ